MKSQFAAKHSGLALVLILSCLVLVSGLLVLLLSRARIDRVNAAAFRSSMDARGLAKFVVAAVQSQITAGTTSTDGRPWASLPGAIRTWSATGNTSGPIFKLYSAPSLTTGLPGPSSVPNSLAWDTAQLANWTTYPGIFSDLNAPVTVNGNKRYPILDPSALDRVEGFDIAGAPGASASQPAPMPVWWLYVLRDGSLVAPTLSGGNVRISGASTENEIVGRVAFWTDDETCKLNVNTAGEGAYWDVPRYHTNAERNFASHQPAQNEFQRYPGHPSTASLAPVFFATSKVATPELTQDQKESLYRILPRLTDGGSLGGSLRVPFGSSPLAMGGDRFYATLDELFYGVTRPAINQLRRADGGLYPITPEIIERSQFFLTANNRAPETNLWNTPRIAIWPTHFSNTPDDPRHTAFDRLIRLCATLNGHLYAFQRQSSTSATNDWDNIPRNRDILGYLRCQTSALIPGIGYSLQGKFGLEDRDQLLVQIFDYIRSSNLYDENLAVIQYGSFQDAENALQFTVGRGEGSYEAYNGHGQVVPIRVPAGLNGVNPPSTPNAPNINAHMGFGRFNTISEAAIHFICMADGSAGDPSAPIGGSEGSIRRESNNPTLNRALGGTPLAPNEKLVQAMLYFEWFSPMAGWTALLSDFFIEVEQPHGTFQLNGQDLEIPNRVTIIQPHESDRTGASGFSATAGAWGVHPWGGSASFRPFLAKAFVPARGHMPEDAAASDLRPYGLVSALIRVDTSSGTMRFEAPEKTIVRIFAGRPGGIPELVQTIELKFPAADFPIPDLVSTGTSTHPEDPSLVATAPRYWWSFHRDGVDGTTGGRLRQITNRPYESAGNIIREGDVVRTLVPFHGDYRLVAASHFVPVGVFQPSATYFSTSWTDRILSFLSGSGSADHFINSYIRQPVRALVSGVTYHQRMWPDMPAFITSASSAAINSNEFQTLGDFDTAPAEIFDGPYINKPDEGDAAPGNITPYFDFAWEYRSSGPTFFSPNRQLPGAGMFGSLPVHTYSGNKPFVSVNAAHGKPWRTLLFRPQPGHPGGVDPPDSLIMDHECPVISSTA